MEDYRDYQLHVICHWVLWTFTYQAPRLRMRSPRLIMSAPLSKRALKKFQRQTHFGRVKRHHVIHGSQQTLKAGDILPMIHSIIQSTCGVRNQPLMWILCSWLLHLGTWEFNSLPPHAPPEPLNPPGRTATDEGSCFQFKSIFRYNFSDVWICRKLLVHGRTCLKYITTTRCVWSPSMSWWKWLQVIRVRSRLWNDRFYWAKKSNISGTSSSMTVSCPFSCSIKRLSSLRSTPCSDLGGTITVLRLDEWISLTSALFQFSNQSSS